MEERNPSTTALNVAALRAAHQLLDGEPKILDDPIAVRLFQPEYLRQMQENPGRFLQPRTLDMRSHVLLRSRYTEDRLAMAVQRGMGQYVILGAGFDTFAYRQPEWARSLRVFEVDHPASQRMKRRRLEGAGVSLPPNLEYVPIDFESVSLREGVRHSSLDPAAPAFFSCLGVIMYLTEEAADSVFRLAASFPRSSELVFTYLSRDGSEGSALSPGRAALASRVEAKGEPFITFFDPEELAVRLAALGFSQVNYLTHAEAAACYFAGRGDALRVPGHIDIASTTV